MTRRSRAPLLSSLLLALISLHASLLVAVQASGFQAHAPALLPDGSYHLGELNADHAAVKTGRWLNDELVATGERDDGRHNNGARHVLAAKADSDAASANAAAAAAAASDVRYFVLIDAGSTGSRAHVHKYNVASGKPLPIVHESQNKKIKPGLSSYAAEPVAASQSVQDLLEFIKATVPENQWAATPLHLQATAGLRSVTPAEASAILEVVRSDLLLSGFLFEPHWARIISGEQEGINGWMAVNYLLGVFDEHGEAPPSTGVVEMGGSSMQITFAPKNPSHEDRKLLNEVRVAGASHWLYTHSFLQYGLQAAEKLYQKLAIDHIEDAGNPCYPKSFRHSSIGDFKRCTALLNSVVDKSVKCVASSCSFNGVFQPKIQNENFLAIENFFYTAKFFGHAAQPDYSPDADAADAADPATPSGGLVVSENQFIGGLRRKGEEFCNEDWSTLTSKYSGTPKEELSDFCFSAAYQTVVLESGLGFHPESNLRVAKTIKGKGIDWEMGAVLFELIPKDAAAIAADAALAAQVSESGKRRTVGEGFVLDPVTGVVRPAGSSEGFSGGTSFCPKCALYTVLIAVAALATYMGVQRFRKRSSSQAPSYSQLAFNRV